MTTKNKGPKDQAIQKVSRLTGLNPHVILIWEKRYGAVTPERTLTNRRIYTEADIERLQLLGYLTREGRRIGQVARLSLGELKELVDNLEREKKADESAQDSPSQIMQACLQAIEALNSPELDIFLAKATVFMNPVAVIQTLIIPLIEEISQRVRQGRLRLVHERFTFAAFRPFLANFMKSYEVPADAPHLVSTSLIGQLQEFGALYLLSAAAATGWRATYLGPNLPAEEIAAGIHQLKANLLVLSFQQPRNDPRLFGELQNLRKLLPPETKILAVGSGVSGYQEALGKVGAPMVTTFSEVLQTLESLNEQKTA
jgi:DNA-binding transcriptional MerR regulator